VNEVIANAHLTTFTVDAENGESLAPLARELATRAGVDTVAPFGASLHVSGRDGAALEAAIAPYQTRPGLDWQRSSASLEDVFIALMAEARDNFE
jgi:ABC-2 type transport system ATP-binding protein